MKLVVIDGVEAKVVQEFKDHKYCILVVKKMLR